MFYNSKDEKKWGQFSFRTSHFLLKDDPLKEKSYQFAIRIVKLSQFLQQDKKEFVLSKQVLRVVLLLALLFVRRSLGKARQILLAK